MYFLHEERLRGRFRGLRHPGYVRLRAKSQILFIDQSCALSWSFLRNELMVDGRWKQLSETLYFHNADARTGGSRVRLQNEKWKLWVSTVGPLGPLGDPRLEFHLCHEALGM